jgi:hypothetical protein
MSKQQQLQGMHMSISYADASMPRNLIKSGTDANRPPTNKSGRDLLMSSDNWEY